MRKEFIFYLVIMTALSGLWGILSPLASDVVIENKITSINKEEQEIYFINKYGNFKCIDKDWVKTRKEKQEYKDTLSYGILFNYAINDKTIDNINKDSNLSKFHVVLASKCLGPIIIIFLAISVFLFACIINALFKFLEKAILTVLLKYKSFKS